MSTSEKQLKRFKNDRGFVAALDQSGGSTPKALRNYGVTEDAYSTEEEMFDEVHRMRSRIITDPKFNGERILGAILFEGTAAREVAGKPTASYLWEDKNIVPFIKIDKGLSSASDGVQLMKDIPDIDKVLKKAKDRGAFGTKMRSVIDEASETGIAAIVEQQFTLARRILEHGLIPIVEPEVSIDSQTKGEAEKALKAELEKRLDELSGDQRVIFKLTLPEEDNLYRSFTEHDKVVRVLALSGGYERDEANNRLARNVGMIASFSRALLEDLKIWQSPEEFSTAIDEAVGSIYEASST